MGESRISAKYGALAFFRWRPASYGYWIAKQFPGAFPDWKVTKQGLYAAIGTLHEDGWIEPLEPVEVGAGCHRMPYRLTPLGEQMFDRFLAKLDRRLDLPNEHVPHEYFALRVRIAAWEGLQSVLALLDGLETRVTKRLDRLGHAPAPKSLNELGDWLFVKEQQHALYARLSWIQDAREAAEIVGGGEAGR